MTAVQRIRLFAKRGFSLLARVSWYRDAATSFVVRLNRATFARLRRNPAIVDVFVRGSFTRGTFTPIVSDLDLALVLENDLGRTVEGVRSAMDTLASARRWNPSLRDWWQHVFVQDELAVVERLWSVYGAEEWRTEDGYRPVVCRGNSDPRRLAFATWAQMCHWSASAFHAELEPSDPIHSFEAGVEKTLLFSSRLSALNDDEVGPLPAEALGAFKTRHAQLFEQDFARFRRAAGRAARLRSVFRVLEAGARRLNPQGTAGLVRTLASTDACFLVIPSGLSDRDLDRVLMEATRRPLPKRRWTSIVPANAEAIWPFPATELKDLDTGQPVVPESPMARDLYLFDTLFLPSAARLALSFRDPVPRLRRALLGLLRGLLLYGRNTTALSPAAVAAALHAAPEIFSAPSAVVDAWLKDPARPSPPSGELFAACSAAADRLHQALMTSLA